MLENNKNRLLSIYTLQSNLLYGLNEAINMLMEEGLENVFARHKRHADATRLAVRSLGFRNIS